jgi:hypothetical protein
LTSRSIASETSLTLAVQSPALIASATQQCMFLGRIG